MNIIVLSVHYSSSRFWRIHFISICARAILYRGEGASAIPACTASCAFVASLSPICICSQPLVIRKFTLRHQFLPVKSTLANQFEKSGQFCRSVKSYDRKSRFRRFRSDTFETETLRDAWSIVHRKCCDSADVSEESNLLRPLWVRIRKEAVEAGHAKVTKRIVPFREEQSHYESVAFVTLDVLDTLKSAIASNELSLGAAPCRDHTLLSFCVFSRIVCILEERHCRASVKMA